MTAPLTPIAKQLRKEHRQQLRQDALERQRELRTEPAAPTRRRASRAARRSPDMPAQLTQKQLFAEANRLQAEFRAARKSGRYEEWQTQRGEQWLAELQANRQALCAELGRIAMQAGLGKAQPVARDAEQRG